MNSQLQDQIVTDIAKRMSEDIDFDVFASVLCKEGWTKFQLPRFIDNHHAVDISYWLADYCQGEYKRNGRTFLFKESKDATMFILRWGS